MTQLTLRDFRNIETADFSPAPALTVICGNNGQGKTNLIEGVWMLTGSKSFRGAKDAELIREACMFAVLEGSVVGDRPAPRTTQKNQAASSLPQCMSETMQTKSISQATAPLTATNRVESATENAENDIEQPVIYSEEVSSESLRETGSFSQAKPNYSPAFLKKCNGDVSVYEKKIRVTIAGDTAPPKGRNARVNGVDYGRATNLAGIFTAVVFAPNHLNLMKGSPEGRRKFIDAALCQLYPRYLSLLHRYVRTLAQKNALLKSLRGASASGGHNQELLEVFDETLAESGTQISIRRRTYLEGLSVDAAQNYHDISNGSEAFFLCFEPSFSGESLLPVLRASRARDIAVGFCTTGTHREDFTVTLDGRAAKTYGSQGQQRSAVLSLKLAEAAAAQRVTGEHPVMLLDDVLSELDETRQSYLLNRMEDKQTIVTACDAGLFSRTRGKLYTMEGGRLRAR